MNKKLLLTSAAILSMSAIAAPTVVSAATNDATIISGPQVKSDKTVDSSINSLTSAKQKVIIQGASSNVTTDTQQAFLNSAVPMAQKASAEYNVYTSVMLAQAILESNWGTSDKAVQGHNLFGIKGDYNGQSVYLPTKEWSTSQGWYAITAAFRSYPTYYESFADNGNKLRNGVAWDSSYYKGTWKENAASYKDATAWLQGRYATAPTYAASLNNVIETYNLTQYDTNNTDTSTTQPPVTNENGDQITTKSGVVHVTSKSAIAHLYSTDHVKSSVRALAPDTYWQYDRVAVHSDGSTWYRVSTDEWVSANDAALS